MRRAPGWTTLAGIALELTALAFIARVVMGRDDEKTLVVPSAPAPAADPVTPPPSGAVTPIDFVRESADAGTRLYRASGEDLDLLAGFYSDGRVRLAGAQHRFAGMLAGSQADLLEIDSNRWSQLLVHTTPGGNLQLELRGGPYDARVLTCEPLTS